MRGRISSTIVLAFAAALATAALATAAAPIANLNVTAMPGNEAEDAIAVNPTNPSNVVAMSTLPDVVAGLAVGVSFNSGRTWSRSVIGATASDPLGAEGSDELRLEIGLADVEARLQAGSLEGPPEVGLLARIAEARDSEALKALEEPADRLRAAHRDDLDPFGREVAAAALRERFQCDPVAGALDQHDPYGSLHGMFT